MQIHETAFITATYRSFHEEVSKDSFAKLWNNYQTELLIPPILDTISDYEPILHSLRNRFLYEQMNSFFSIHSGGTLINFGAGFSMYQFSLDANVHTIEIDKKEIITYKKEKIEHWTETGVLPYRDTQYVAIDFNSLSSQEIINYLQPLLKKGPTFILLEGVLFFLNRATTNKLFKVFKEIQQEGDLVGSVSYLPEIETTKVYHRLLDYFNSNNDSNDSFSHQTIPTSYFETLDGYQLKEHTDEFMLSKTYATEISIKDKTDILNENMYVLKKV